MDNGPFFPQNECDHTFYDTKPKSHPHLISFDIDFIVQDSLFATILKIKVL